MWVIALGFLVMAAGHLAMLLKQYFQFDLFVVLLGQNFARNGFYLALPSTWGLMGAGAAMIVASTNRDKSAIRESRDQSEYLAAFSHEVRTPLNAIMGYAQLLDKIGLGNTDLRTKECVQHILSGGDQLVRMDDKIVEFTADDNYHSDEGPGVCDPAEVVREVVGNLQATATVRGVSLHAETVGESAAEVAISNSKLTRVLEEVIQNAIIYGPGDNGRVDIQLSYTDRGVEFDLQDNGQGFRQSASASVFDPYNRLAQLRGPESGVGLGLSLAKRYVEAAGGNISVSSAPNAGSHVTIELPRTGT